MAAKNWYDAKDMRSTGGDDVNFAMDVPKVDSPDIAEMRQKGGNRLRDNDRNGAGVVGECAGCHTWSRPTEVRIA